MTIGVQRPVRTLIYLHDNGSFFITISFSGIARCDISKAACTSKRIPLFLHVKLISCTLWNISNREGSVIVLGGTLASVSFSVFRKVVLQICYGQISKVQFIVLL